MPYVVPGFIIIESAELGNVKTIKLTHHLSTTASPVLEDAKRKPCNNNQHCLSFWQLVVGKVYTFCVSLCFLLNLGPQNI